VTRLTRTSIDLGDRVRPRPYEPLSDDEHNENDEEQDENAENLYHKPAIGRHRLEILYKFGVCSFNAYVSVVHVRVDSAFTKKFKKWSM